MPRQRPQNRPARPGLTEEDYYTNEQGFVVFTAAYHQKRGYCCKNGCLHCPYGFRKA